MRHPNPPGYVMRVIGVSGFLFSGALQAAKAESTGSLLHLAIALGFFVGASALALAK